jgi:hypothetical protein
LYQKVEDLAGLDLTGLRAAWQEHFGLPPKLRSTDLLRHLLAWRLQVALHGGLDRESRRRLTRRGAVVPEGQHLGLGAVLRRDWQGRRIEVVVETGGFRWEGKLYPSLSAVARAVTGSRWNGPRFFGLREMGQ